MNTLIESSAKLIFDLIRWLIEDPKSALYVLLFAGAYFGLKMLAERQVFTSEQNVSPAARVYERKISSAKEKKDFQRLARVLYVVLSALILVLVMVLVKRMSE